MRAADAEALARALQAADPAAGITGDDQVVGSADPAAGITGDDQVVGLVADLARAVTRADPAAPAGGPLRLGVLGRGRRRRHAVGVAVTALAATAVLGTAAFTFGPGLVAHTGWFGTPGATENDASEWLNIAAPDFPGVARSLEPTDIPLPAGRTWQPAVDSQVASGRSMTGLMQVTGVKATFALYAICVWDDEWLAARAAGDTGRSARALAVMRGAPEWPIIAAVDGGGVRDGLRATADAAARGDEQPARQYLAANCDVWLGAGR